MKKINSKILALLSSPLKVNMLAMIVFCAAGLTLVFHHEMWRDEMHAWLIARESTSIFNLYDILKYDGHPGLWHLILMPLTYFSQAGVAMQLVHLLIAACAAGVFLVNAPFTQSQKILFIFGYFPFFEYSIIARNYALGLLLLFIFCTLYTKPKKNYGLIGITIALLANTSILATIVALCLLAVLFLDCILNNKESVKGKLLSQLSSLGIAAIGTLFAVVQMIPPPDTNIATAWNFKYSFGQVKTVMTNAANGYFPLPIPSSQFWGTNLFFSYPATTLLTVLFLIFFIYQTIRLLTQSRSALALYALGTLGLLSFFYTKYLGYTRHHGFVYIVLIASLWIAIKQSPQKALLENFSFVKKLSYSSILTVILCIHVAGSMVAFAVEYQKPFSNAYAASEFIRAHHLESREMVGFHDFNATPIAGYLNKPFIYFPESNAYGNYVRWDLKRKQISQRMALESAIHLQIKIGSPILIIMSSSIDDLLLKEFSLEEVAQFTDAIVPDENIYLYQSKGSPRV